MKTNHRLLSLIYFSLATLYFVFELFISYSYYGDLNFSFIKSLIYITGLVITGYIVNYILLPRFLYKNRFLEFILYLTIVCVIIAVLVGFCQVYLSYTFKIEMGSQKNSYAGLAVLVIQTILFTIASSFIRIFIDKKEREMELLKVNAEKKQAEIDYLKSQINPHFIFNTLNTVFFQIDKSNEIARNTVHEFSNLLRYHLKVSTLSLISIEEEIEYLNNYINLHNKRFGTRSQITFEIEETVYGFQIPPLLFMPLFENAFKYSYSDKPGGYVRIQLKSEPDYLICNIENSVSILSKTGLQGHGIGHKNLIRRLELFFNENFEFDTNSSRDRFFVMLKIPIAVDLTLQQTI